MFFKNHFKYEIKNLVLSFLFPLWPIKVFRNVHTMALLGMMIALRIVLQFFSVYIPTVNLSISLGWMPIIIIGWIFGPVFGFITGAITDTITFFIKPGVWFWMYAIQEPIVGLMSGIFSFIYLIRKNNIKNNKRKGILDICILEIIIISFSAICFFSIHKLFEGSSFEGQTSKLEGFFIEQSKYIVTVCLITFFLIVQLAIYLTYKKMRNSFISNIWIICMVCMYSIIFSFILGPIVSNEYYKYLYNKDSPNFIKYGAIFYLIPRTIKESIKCPIQITLLAMLIPLCENRLKEIKSQLQIKWKNANKIY